MPEIQQVSGRKSPRFEVFGEDTRHRARVLVHVIRDQRHEKTREFVELADGTDGAIRLPGSEFLEIKSRFRFQVTVRPAIKRPRSVQRRIPRDP